MGSAGGPNPKALPMRESFNRDNVIMQHCPAAPLSRGRPHARKSNAHALTSARLFGSLSCAGTLAAMLGTSSGQRLPHFLRGGPWSRRGGRLAPRRPRLRLWWGGRVPVPALPTDAGIGWQGVRPPRLLPGAVREAVPISSQSHGAADKPATEPPRPSRTLRYSRQAVRERPDWGWGRR